MTDCNHYGYLLDSQGLDAHRRVEHSNAHGPGTFFIMEFLDGRVFIDQSLPGLFSGPVAEKQAFHTPEGLWSD